MSEAAFERGKLNREPARIAIVTSYPPHWRPLAKITNQMKAEYAERWGYHFFTDESYRLVNVEGQGQVELKGFVKFDIVSFFLQNPPPVNEGKPYDWVVWTDADWLITNKDIRLEEFINLRTYSNQDLILGYDTNGHHSTVFFVQNTPLARDFIWACNNAGRNLFLLHPWHEMEAMRYFLQTPPYNTMACYLSAKLLCPIKHDEYQPHVPEDIGLAYAWEPGDFAMHMSAMSVERRFEIAMHYADPAHHKTPMPVRSANLG